MGTKETDVCGCFEDVRYERGNFLSQIAGIQAAPKQVKKLITKLRLSKGVLFETANNENIIHKKPTACKCFLQISEMGFPSFPTDKSEYFVVFRKKSFPQVMIQPNEEIVKKYTF